VWRPVGVLELERVTLEALELEPLEVRFLPVHARGLSVLRVRAMSAAELHAELLEALRLELEALDASSSGARLMSMHRVVRLARLLVLEVPAPLELSSRDAQIIADGGWSNAWPMRGDS
jgi:hypothetical protein